jgi:hypothetical protein
MGVLRRRPKVFLAFGINPRRTMKSKDMMRTTAIAAVCAAIGTAGGIAGVSAATNGNNGSGSSSGSSSGQSDQNAAPQGAPQGAPPIDPSQGGHVGPNGVREELLTGDTAAKVRQAALDKVGGGTVERVETDADHGSPYEAHIRRSDGTELEVLVNKDFRVTAVNEMQHP